VRAAQLIPPYSPNGPYLSYWFTYNTDPIPHLISINGVDAGWTFAYAENQALSSPFSPPVSYGNTTLLQSATITAAGQTNIFSYSGGTGKLTSVVLPYGGSVSWQYRGFTFAGGKTVREVQYRYLVKQSGAAAQTYQMWRDDATDANNNMHYFGAMFDPTGAAKGWYFALQPGAWWNGLLSTFVQNGPPVNAPIKLKQQVFNWTLDPAGNPYINSAATTLDPGAAYQQTTTTTQTLDAYENETQTQIYDFGNPNTPARHPWVTTCTKMNPGVRWGLVQSG
jgi:hypothetical protein